VAIEGDEEIFKAILEPLIAAPVTEGSKKQRLDANPINKVLQIEELANTIIIPLNQYCK
jgi:hypothetical protein